MLLAQQDEIKLDKPGTGRLCSKDELHRHPLMYFWLSSSGYILSLCAVLLELQSVVITEIFSFL